MATGQGPKQSKDNPKEANQAQEGLLSSTVGKDALGTQKVAQPGEEAAEKSGPLTVDKEFSPPLLAEARGELSTNKPVVNSEVPGVGDGLHGVVGTVRLKHYWILKDKLRRLERRASGRDVFVVMNLQPRTAESCRGEM